MQSTNLLPLKYWHVVHAQTVGDAVRALWDVEGKPEEVTPETIVQARDRVGELVEAYGKQLKSTKFQRLVEIRGQRYEYMRADKAPIGWYADLVSLPERRPDWVAALLYIPAGSKYGEVDGYGNIKYPMEERAKVFAEHFPLVLFTHALVDFGRCMERVGEYMRITRITTNGQRMGWEEVFYYIAKFYRLSFFDVMDLNVRTFYHLVTVANQIIEKENERYKRKLAARS
jgi:hypothetical protein